MAELTTTVISAAERTGASPVAGRLQGARSQGTLEHALRAPKIKESLGNLGFPVVGSTPTQFAAWLRSDLESHKKMLDSGAVKIQ